MDCVIVRRFFTSGFIGKLIGLIICVFVIGKVFAGADNYCMDDWACVEKIEKNKQVSYWLYNKKPFVVTVTLEVDTSNLKTSTTSQRRHIITQVLQGHQRVNVLELQPIKSHRKVWYDESFYWTPGNMLAEHKRDTVYQYPYAQDDHFRIVQGFGGGYSHRGASKYAVDFAMPLGTPIHAARAGVVIDLVEHHSRGGANRKYAKYANYVVILHEDDTTGEYYHLQKNGVVVSLGSHIKVGDKIGYSGNTGFSSLPHLHFAVYHAQPFGKYQSVPFVFASPMDSNLPSLSNNSAIFSAGTGLEK